MTSWRFDPGNGDVLTVVDHASNHVPERIDLGIDKKFLNTHVAWDIGVAKLAAALGFPAFLATVSRLVVDMNRDEEDIGIVPHQSDGLQVPGNLVHHRARIDEYHKPYHAALRRQIAIMQPKLLLSLHSFTPRLESCPDEARPWEIGILYNNDDRAARVAIPLLQAKGVYVGDQLPYSGKTLNATMNRHGESTGMPYLGIEVRQDLISNAAGVARWAHILLPVIEKCAKR